MILSAQTIRRRGIVSPFCERTVFEGVSYGLSSHGYDVRIDDSLELWPGDFVLASTIERFDMPADLCATVHDKSTWVRKGLCAQTTVIEAGWRGHLTLELTLHGSRKLFIPAGAGIAQILFHRLDEPTEQPYRGKYQDQQSGPQPAIFEGGKLRQTDCTSWTVAAWLPAEGCYGVQLVSGSRETAEEHRRMFLVGGYDPVMIDVWETSVRVLRGRGA